MIQLDKFFKGKRMRNIKITYAYDGSDFYGFQRQPDKRTVQGEIERVLKIVEKLKEHNYLNDRDFAVSFINCHKSWGSRKLEYNLLMKGVDRNIIRELLEDNQDDEIEEIKKLWIKMGDKEERKKIESLMRKGFQYSAIREAKKEL